MASLRAFLFNTSLRYLMKRHGDKPIDIKRMRHFSDNPRKDALKVPKDFRVAACRTDCGLSFDIADKVEPRPRAPSTVVLYLHGGGYFCCSPKTHRQVIIETARAFDAPVYGLDYRLAPEHPFPAAVEDADAAYRWLLKKHPGAKIVLAGDSAGGGLAVATAAAMRDAGLQRAAAIVGFSPWTDLAVTGASVEGNARRCAMFTPKGVRAGATLYVSDADAKDPRASPLYADLKGLPPMLLFASRDEILLDDTVRLAERAKKAGVDVELILRDKLPHVWPIFVRFLPEGKEALALVTKFAHRLQLRST
jgi:epsilon-lactone hydrolase